MIVEKKIAVINKWLERLVQSYKSGAMENALLEAECAKADLEDLRQDVWAKIIRPAKKSGFSLNAFNFNVMSKSFSGVLILSVLIVMLMVVPIKKDVLPVTANNPVKVKIENEVVNNNNSVKNNLSAENLKPVQAQTQIQITNNKKTAPAKKRNAAPSKKLAVKSTHNQSNANAKMTANEIQNKSPENNRKKIPYDSVFYLMQTGERALKNNNSVINIK